MAKSRRIVRFSYTLGDQGRMELRKSSEGGLVRVQDVARLVRIVRGYMAQEVSEDTVNNELNRYPKTKEFTHEP